MKALKWCSAFALVCIMAACNQPKEAKEKSSRDSEFLNELCLPGAQGHWRGISLGMTPEEVRSKLVNEPSYFSDTLIVEEFGLDSPQGYVRINYTFDAIGLFEIQADVLVKETLLRQRSFLTLQQYFDDLYGEGECQDNYCSYSTFSRQNTVVDLTLSYESEVGEHPFISINFLELLSDGY